MSEMVDKGKEVGEKAKALAGAGVEKLKSVDWKAQGEAAREKTKAAWSEIKTNFKADEGTSGYRKIQSMFINLWKSGTTGKAALIAGAVVILLLPFVLGTSKVEKYAQLQNETQELMVQLCELDDFLGHKDTLVPWILGRSLKDEADTEKEINEVKKASSKELDAAITMMDSMRKELEEELKKKKAECKEKGLVIGDSSPLRVAKKFILSWRSKDANGMRKLIHGDNAADVAKNFCNLLSDPSKEGKEVKKVVSQLESIGPTFFNEKRDKALVALADENGGPIDESTRVYGGLQLTKIGDDWCVDGENPIGSSETIVNQ